MNKKMAREIVESLPSLYPLMTADEEEAIWTVLATNSNTENDGDCISRQAAIDVFYDLWGTSLTRTVDAIKQLPPVQPDNQVHLCDSCSYTYPECPSVYTDMIFGNGTGNDNICACSKYLPSAQHEQNLDEWCYSCKEYDKEKHSCPRWNKVIKNTVDELKSAQPEPCEDAVSRFAVQCLLAHFVARDKYTDAVDGLKHLPSVTPKQRIGHWYPVGMAEVVGGESAQWGSAIAYHRCSECDEQALRDDFEQEVLSKWCPHCGAKMEGVSE